jgi:hypothetical protein
MLFTLRVLGLESPGRPSSGRISARSVFVAAPAP